MFFVLDQWYSDIDDSPSPPGQEISVVGTLEEARTIATKAKDDFLEDCRYKDPKRELQIKEISPDDYIAGGWEVLAGMKTHLISTKYHNLFTVYILELEMGGRYTL